MGKVLGSDSDAVSPNVDSIFKTNIIENNIPKQYFLVHNQEFSLVKSHGQVKLLDLLIITTVVQYQITGHERAE